MEIDRHSFSNLLLGSSWDTSSIFVFNYVKITIPVMSEPISRRYFQKLCHLKFNFWNIKFWLRIIYHHISAGNFVGIKHIFIKFALKNTVSFIAAAACSQGDLLLILGILNELYWWFMDYQHLFIFENVIRMCDNRC